MSSGILHGLVLSAAVLATAAAVTTAQPSMAQAFAAKPVRLVVTLGAGGAVDIVARIIADEMSKPLGQPVIVENRPGGAGMVAAVLVKNAPADGGTLLVGATASQSPVFVKDNPLLATRELAPISGLVVGDWFLYVPAGLGVNSLKDLAAYAKANPLKFKFASPSVVNNLLMAMLARRMGFSYENIPYKTSDQTVLAAINGDVQSTAEIAGYKPE